MRNEEQIRKEAKTLFKNYLHENNMKSTVEREKILDEVFNTHAHFDVEELLKLLTQKKIKTSRATIYRTLELLTKCELVNKHRFDDNYYRYEHTLGHKHHDHMICVNCGSIIEFYSAELEALQKEICKSFNFREKKHKLQIYGYCENCDDCLICDKN